MEGVCRTDHLKRSLILTSILYEYYGWSLISDTEWDKRAYELVQRIKDKKNTDLFKKEFRGWKGETGMQLLKNDWGKDKAHYFNLNREYFDK